MKGAIIGFGYIGSKGHLPAFLKTPGFEISAIADICPRRREAVRKAYPHLRVYENHQELLATEKSLDFIDIATPPRDHVEIALAGLNQGLHVLCEKPIATELADARRLLVAAKEAKRVVMPCHNYKHAPVVKTIRSLIDRGQLGRVRTATISTYRTTHARGTQDWDTHWRRKRNISGGGIAMDHGSHSFYVTFLFMNGYPSSLTAKTFQSDSEYDTEDTVSCALAFPQGIVNVYLTWTAGVRKVIYTLHGENGAAVIDDDDLQLVTKQGTQRLSIRSDFNDASHTDWFASLFEQFRHAVETGDYVNRELEEAYLCIQLISLIYRSSTHACAEQQVNRSMSFLQMPPPGPQFRAAS